MYLCICESYFRKATYSNLNERFEYAVCSVCIRSMFIYFRASEGKPPSKLPRITKIVSSGQTWINHHWVCHHHREQHVSTRPPRYALSIVCLCTLMLANNMESALLLAPRNKYSLVYCVISKTENDWPCAARSLCLVSLVARPSFLYSHKDSNIV